MTRSVEIPDEAVKAAVNALYESRYPDDPTADQAQWSAAAKQLVAERRDKLRPDARAAVAAALPYLVPAGLCACGKPATHVNADPDDADWACRVPAGDGGLREALERLAEKWDGMDTRALSAPSNQDWAQGVDSAYDTAASELRGTLSDHPAAPAVLQPADERPLRAALEKYFSNGGPDTPISTTWHDGVEHWEAPADDIRELIAGSAVPLPVDREALERLFETHGVFETTFISTEIVEGRRRTLSEAVADLLNGSEGDR